MLTLPTNAFEEKVYANIKEHGYQLNYIFDPDKTDPPYMYSVGLWHSYKHPEIIVIGLHQETSSHIFKIIADHLKGGGAHYEPKEKYLEFIPDYECIFLPVLPQRFEDYLLTCNWLYGEHAFPVLQLVFQDEKHLWPWDEEASKTFVNSQPIL